MTEITKEYVASLEATIEQLEKKLNFYTKQDQENWIPFHNVAIGVHSEIMSELMVNSFYEQVVALIATTGIEVHKVFDSEKEVVGFVTDCKRTFEGISVKICSNTKYNKIPYLKNNYRLMLIHSYNYNGSKLPKITEIWFKHE